ncbi:MAG: hypothetical protein M1825_005616 [Sarcosagium campestre]|nr:MAG: hypothetical protein M1825_005616 [Sarcosagium campestre]
MSQTLVTRPFSHFLALPREVRNAIYAYLLPAFEWRQVGRGGSRKLVSHVYPEILLVNHQVNDEAADWLYGENIIHMYCNDLESFEAHARRIHPIVQNRNFRRIKLITLNILINSIDGHIHNSMLRREAETHVPGRLPAADYYCAYRSSRCNKVVAQLRHVVHALSLLPSLWFLVVKFDNRMPPHEDCAHCLYDDFVLDCLALLCGRGIRLPVVDGCEDGYYSAAMEELLELRELDRNKLSADAKEILDRVHPSRRTIDEQSNTQRLLTVCIPSPRPEVFDCHVTELQALDRTHGVSQELALRGQLLTRTESRRDIEPPTATVSPDMRHPNRLFRSRPRLNVENRPFMHSHRQHSPYLGCLTQPFEFAAPKSESKATKDSKRGHDSDSDVLDEMDW